MSIFIRTVRRLAEERAKFKGLIDPSKATMMTDNSETERADPVKARAEANKKKFSSVLQGNKPLDIESKPEQPRKGSKAEAQAKKEELLKLRRQKLYDLAAKFRPW